MRLEVAVGVAAGVLGVAVVPVVLVGAVLVDDVVDVDPELAALFVALVLFLSLLLLPPHAVRASAVPTATTPMIKRPMSPPAIPESALPPTT